MQSEEAYKLLPTSDDEPNGEPISGGGLLAQLRSRASIRDWVLGTQSLVLLVLLVGWFWGLTSKEPQPTCQVLYSPAEEAIKYEVKRWSESFWAPNVYKGEPSDEVDKAWTDLYNDFGVSQIPKWQAQLLPNRTLPIPANPEYHIIQLSVFHQMHCLNTIRKALRPDYYVDPITGDLGNIKKENLGHHLSHCMDSLRQGIMCASDVSPIVWAWSDYDGRAIIDMDVVHSCRNYDMVVEWAKEHHIIQHFDWSVRVDDSATHERH